MGVVVAGTVTPQVSLSVLLVIIVVVARRTTVTQPRRHHYLPQFYLAGFSTNGTRKGKLRVHDTEQGKTWCSKPSGIAYQIDYYRMSDTTGDPFALEKGLATFEGIAAETLRAVLENAAIPSHDHRVTLMNFVALTALRVPSQRNIIADFDRRVTTQIMQLAVSSEETWKRVTDGARAAGNDIKDLPFNEMRAFAMDETRYTIEVSRDSLITTALSALDGLIPLLLDRTWKVVVAEEDAGDFICSDNPVARHWTIDNHPPFVPGFGLKHSFIVFPLNRRMVLMGEWGGDEATTTAGRHMVAQINSLIVGASDRFLISPDREFWWFKKDGAVARSGELVDWYRTSPRKRRVAWMD